MNHTIIKVLRRWFEQPYEKKENYANLLLAWHLYAVYVHAVH